MPYLLLIIGCVIGVYALYRFFLSANAQQIKAAFGVTALVVFAGALLFLAVTGRLPTALALLGGVSPFVLGWIRQRYLKRNQGMGGENADAKDTPFMSVSEALEILDLSQPVTKAEIERSYKQLMKKYHPDQEGAAYFAKKLNAARKALLDHISSAKK